MMFKKIIICLLTLFVSGTFFSNPAFAKERLAKIPVLFTEETSTTKEDEKEDNIEHWTNIVCKHCGSDKSFESLASAASDPITINRVYSEIATDDTLQLTVDDVFNEVTWSSSSPDVATVNENGLVTALAYGETEIKAVDKGKNEAVCRIRTKYKDVKDDFEFFYYPAYWAVEKGMIDPDDTSTFGAETTLSKSDVLTALWHMDGSPKVSGELALDDTKDISKDSDTYTSLLWGVAKGLVNADEARTLSPEDPISSMDVINMLYELTSSSDISSLFDIKDVSSAGILNNSPAKAVTWAKISGVLEGAEDSPLDLGAYCQKQYLATFMYNYFDKIKNEDVTSSADEMIEIPYEDIIETSETGLSHDWQEIVVEKVVIDEKELAASLNGSASGVIEIPDELGGEYTITCYGIPGWKLGGVEWRAVARNSRQAVVHDEWIAQGAVYTNGIATLNGRYLIATTTIFGEVGDYVTFICKNGLELKCIIGDSKGTPEECGNMWGHHEGKNVVEFEVDPDYYLTYFCPGTANWFPEIAGGVKAAIKE